MLNIIKTKKRLRLLIVIFLSLSISNLSAESMVANTEGETVIYLPVSSGRFEFLTKQSADTVWKNDPESMVNKEKEEAEEVNIYLPVSQDSSKFLQRSVEENITKYIDYI